jgi:endonuclease-3
MKAKRLSSMQSSVITTDAVISSNIKRIKAAAADEPVPSSSIHSMSMDAKLDYSVKKTPPTPEECYLVVHELGKLHPDVISANNDRRHTFALQKQLLQSNNNDFTSLSSMANNTSTSITDAIISTMLSQNTTAANQNRAFAALKNTFHGWEECAAEANTVRIEDAIRVAGLAKVRAERLLSMLQIIKNERGEANFEYLQNIQSTDEIVNELSRFKGMGPKTISCVLLFALGKPDFPVDTHVLRISKQMGWIGQSFTREAAYDYLNQIVPDDCKLDLHCLLVTHGKQCNKCAARGKAQFPPSCSTKQWVCPMMAIKSGTLVADDSWSTSGPVIKQENQLILSHSFKDIQPIIPVAACSNNDVMVKVEEHGLK